MFLFIELLAVGLSCLKFEGNCIAQGKVDLSLDIHKQLEIALLVMDSFVSTVAFLSMAFQFTNCVMCNFVTLTMYNSFPLYFYGFFPSLSLVLFMVIELTLPYTHKIFELSTELVRNMSLKARNNNLRRRQIRATRPHSIKIGLLDCTLCEFKRRNKVRYYECMVSQTVDLVLLTRY